MRQRRSVWTSRYFKQKHLKVFSLSQSLWSFFWRWILKKKTYTLKNRQNKRFIFSFSEISVGMGLPTTVIHLFLAGDRRCCLQQSVTIKATYTTNNQELHFIIKHQEVTESLNQQRRLSCLLLVGSIEVVPHTPHTLNLTGVLWPFKVSAH